METRRASHLTHDQTFCVVQRGHPIERTCVGFLWQRGCSAAKIFLGGASPHPVLSCRCAAISHGRGAWRDGAAIATSFLMRKAQRKR